MRMQALAAPLPPPKGPLLSRRPHALASCLLLKHACQPAPHLPRLHPHSPPSPPSLTHLHLSLMTIIHAAYRRTCLEAHPDKALVGITCQEEKERIETIFKSIQEAYEVLSDPAKRREYDSTDEFDDSLPSSCDPADFFKVCLCVCEGGGEKGSRGLCLCKVTACRGCVPAVGGMLGLCKEMVALLQPPLPTQRPPPLPCAPRSPQWFWEASSTPYINSHLPAITSPPPGVCARLPPQCALERGHQSAGRG